ncbi:prolyl hydroxylase family protein [Novosphingobium bradum]|uniref:Prolyl hydroxylase family protein n=1 Tax=Novosphingobium bradum TaxID=1737444 RepID=A0ABV7ISM4_9SPHN
MASSSADPATAAPLKDQAALALLGEQVRARLAADPGACKVATDRAEIFAFPDFLGPAECDRFIAMVDAVAVPSAVYDRASDDGCRTSWSGDVNRADPFVRMIERRIDDLLGIDPAFGETVQGQRYTAGQLFEAHFDWFWTLAGYWPEEERKGGQRSWTAMAYLSDVEEGGRTEFNRIGLSIPPQRGLLLVWNNALPDGSPNLDTMHAARPVERGTKYVITKWYRTRAWG